MEWRSARAACLVAAAPAAASRSNANEAKRRAQENVQPVTQQVASEVERSARARVAGVESLRSTAQGPPARPSSRRASPRLRTCRTGHRRHRSEEHTSELQ